MAKLTTEEFIEAIKELSVLELNDLVKACEELCKHLEGPNAIAISKDDATAPARILAKYAKDVKALKLVAGVVEDAYYDEAGITALSSIPSREELLGKLLGSIQSPIANFARVISQIAEKQEEA